MARIALVHDVAGSRPPRPRFSAPPVTKSTRSMWILKARQGRLAKALTLPLLPSVLEAFRTPGGGRGTRDSAPHEV